ncbi:MAG: hypothetical protein ABIS35_01780 [Terracoccus sp.]
MSRALVVTTLFPLTTVAAGDEANAVALRRRGALRGLDVQLIAANKPHHVRDSDLYLAGGNGRTGVVDLVDLIGATDVVDRVRSGRAAMLAVGAGLDALALSFVDPEGEEHDGLGLAPVTVRPATSVTGTVVTEPNENLGLPALIGWESNDVRTERHPGTVALAGLEYGAGDRSDDPADGVVSGTLVGTRLHGPLLALNPELADLVLALATGRDEPWPALPETAVERARAVRIAEVRATHPDLGWRDRLPARVRRLVSR